MNITGTLGFGPLNTKAIISNGRESGGREVEFNSCDVEMFVTDGSDEKKNMQHDNVSSPAR